MNVENAARVPGSHEFGSVDILVGARCEDWNSHLPGNSCALYDSNHGAGERRATT
jgi:hypothetical protein